MGGTDGIGKGSEGGIDGHPADEGGSEGMVGGDEKSKKGHEAPFYFLNDNINKPLFP